MNYIRSLSLALLATGSNACAMHYIRGMLPVLSIAARAGAAGTMAYAVAADADKQFLEITSYPDASEVATGFVQTTLKNHAIPQEEIDKIEIKIIPKESKYARCMAAVGRGGRNMILVPGYLDNNLYDLSLGENVSNPTIEDSREYLEFAIMHEYGHLKSGISEKTFLLKLAAAGWMLKGSAFSIIPKWFCSAVALKVIAPKIDEYTADKEGIRTCSSQVLHFMAQHFRNSHEQRDLKDLARYFNNDFIKDTSWHNPKHQFGPKTFADFMKKYKEYSWFREYVYSDGTGDMHPANLSRANYLEAAALAKKHQEQVNS